MPDDDNTLPEIGFVANFSEAERTTLGSFGEFLSLSEGDCLIDQGHTQDSLFLIIFGTFHVQTGATGRPVLLGTLRTGDSVGEINMFDPGEASASVISKSISQVWKIDRVRLEQYLGEHPREAVQLLVSIATQLSKRLRKTNDKVALAREAMLESY